MRRRKPYLLPLLIFAACLVWTACGRFIAQGPGGEPPPTGQPASDPSDDLPFGNPSNATHEAANRDNYLVIHNGFVLSYNESKGTLNWVAWRTSKSDLGPKLPRHDFEPDTSLPRGFRQIQYYDYSGSGYDRGHMVPSADRFADISRNDDTYLMTNIVPQAKDLNAYPWEKFESYARMLAGRGNEIYSIAGVYGEKGKLHGKVSVPTNCWKVIVVLSPGHRAIEPTTRVLAIDMPNEEGIAGKKWQAFATSVRSIEQKTGLDLFSLLPRDLQDTIETRVDFSASPAY